MLGYAITILVCKAPFEVCHFPFLLSRALSSPVSLFKVTPLHLAAKLSKKGPPQPEGQQPSTPAFKHLQYGCRVGRLTP